MQRSFEKTSQNPAAESKSTLTLVTPLNSRVTGHPEVCGPLVSLGEASIRAARPETQHLFRCAGLRARIGNAGDHPSSVDTNQIEQVCAAVIDLSIDQKVEWRPHHG